MKLKDGFETIGDSIMMVSKNGLIVACNRKFRELFQIKKDDKIKDNPGLAPIADLVLEVLGPGKAPLKGKIIRDDETLLVKVNPVMAGDRLSGAVVLCQDISEYESLALDMKKLNELNIEMEAIFNSSYDEIFVTDGQGYTLKVNKASERLYGIKAEEIIGRHVSELEKEGFFTPSVTSRVLKEKRRITSTQITNLGKKNVVTGNPVFDENGNIIRVVTNSRDITIMSELKERLVKTERMLESSLLKIAQLENDGARQIRVIGVSSTLQRMLEIVDKIAGVDSTVLVMGESGVGKGMVAQEIHKASKRKDGPFITINCGAIPENLLESELFGYQEGAFTGAKKEGKKGLIEMANGGTIFFDEISELSGNLQVKLLHFIQEKRFIPVGGNDYVNVDVRIISATNRDLHGLIKEKKFREDLYYRLNVVPIFIPPLRQRREDISSLAEYFLKIFNERYQLQKVISPAALIMLESYDWPGNVRELENLIERLVVTTNNDEIKPYDLPENINQYDRTGLTKVAVLDICPLKEATEEVERQLLQRVFEKCKNTYKIAQELGINQSTVVRKLKRYGIA